MTDQISYKHMGHIQIRIDDKTKNDAKKVLDQLGMDMSMAVKLYLRQISLRKGIPFPLTTENDMTPLQEQALIDESNQALEAYKTGKLKGYTSTKELLKDLTI